MKQKDRQWYHRSKPKATENKNSKMSCHTLHPSDGTVESDSESSLIEYLNGLTSSHLKGELIS